MLKAKTLVNETLTDPETGTPQGGILSPMLANVALTTLDNFCEKYERRSNPIVRYADDFIVTCKSEKQAEKIKEEIAGMLKETLGLTLSDDKTNVTNIHDGFNFLGFNIRKYRMKSPIHKNHTIGKLLITPQEEKVTDHLWEVKQILKQNKTAKQETIIHLLNPKLQGFALYYRFGVSKKTYSTIDRHLWKKLWKWALRRHPNKTRYWTMKRYFTTYGRKWTFKSEKEEEITNVAKIPIVRFVKVKSGMRVHGGDKETIEYWKKREYTNALSQIYSVKVEKLFRRQKGVCPYCGQSITKEAIEKGLAHAHHLIPRTQGGSEELKDLRLVHKECHTEAHSIMSREQMAYWWRNKGNYLRRSNIEAFAQADMNTESTQSVEKSIKKRKEKVTRQRKLEASNRQAQAAETRATQMLREGHL
jgi:RNA-directed DNA polymerase